MKKDKQKSPLRLHDIRTGARQERERIVALIKNQPGMVADQMINGDHLLFEIERTAREVTYD